MRQSKAAGRTAGSARRVALTSLGAGLVVGAAAPMASAATIADQPPLTSSSSPLTSSALTSSAPLPSTALTSAAPIDSSALTSAAPVDSSALASSTLTSSAPLNSSVLTSSAPLNSSGLDSMASAAGLADSALTLSTAALSGANGNWSHLGRVKLYPLAGTGIDPLSNMVSTDLGGIPVSTAPVSQMMSDGLPITDLPIVGALLGTPQD